MNTISLKNCYTIRKSIFLDNQTLKLYIKHSGIPLKLAESIVKDNVWWSAGKVPLLNCLLSQKDLSQYLYFIVK